MDRPTPRARPRRAAGRAALALATVLLPACGDRPGGPAGGRSDAAASWLPLAGLYEPPRHARGEGGPGGDDGRAAFEAWIAVPAERWSAGEDGRFRTPHPDGGLPALPGSALELEIGGAPAGFEKEVRPSSNLEGLDAVTTTEVVLEAGRTEPPRDARFRATLAAGERRGDAWRVAFGDRIADGFPLRSGSSVELALPAAARGVLSFEAAFRDHGATGAPATLTVVADGVERRTVALVDGAEPPRVEVPLDEPASALRFELTGAPGVGVVHVPGISAPAGESAARPPDLVLFLADTFRDDLLDARSEGGAPLLPNLRRLAERGRRYERVWAPAPWTLPSTASLLFGRYPYDHVAVDYDRRPREDLRSLADHLAAHGYRTAAVTEGVFVSRLYGMDRGFEVFEEGPPGDLARTVARARARLAAGDGRPLFLLVHTYRTHAPYHVSEELLAERGAELGATRTWDELITTLTDSVSSHLELAPGQAMAGREWDVLLDFIDRDGWLDTVEELDGGASASPRGVLGTLEGLYRATAVELDRELGALLDELERRPGEPVVAFTSDHGEAFGEHDRVFHGLGLWEELLRVPLVVAGPGVEPGRSSVPASLVDLPATLCRLVGVAPDPLWTGRDLAAAEDAVPLYAFDTERQARPRIAIVDFPWKVGVAADPTALRDGERLFAYDLARDPGEREDRAGDAAAAAAVDLSPVLGMLGSAAAEGPRVEIDEEQRRLLDALGYR